MGETKPAWTPGPWQLEDDVNGFLIRGNPSFAEGEWSLAEVGDYSFWDVDGACDEDRANARLIAAAPDMAAALEANLAVLEMCGDYPRGPEFYGHVAEALKQSRAALSTARGGTP